MVIDDNNLTSRQQDILNYIKYKIRIDGYPPSVREIGEAVGLKSSSTVHAHLLHLEQKGFLRRDPAKPRAIIPVDNDNDMLSQSISLPIVGKVAAGVPITAEQNIDNYMSVPDDFIGSGTHFLLKVAGESMIEAGIMDGDYLIVHQQEIASNGEIVVALIEDEATVKRFYRREKYIELRPENSAMQPIISDQVQIVGKVTGLLRRM
ncbi:MAG: transcriptional repressor LexA [Syntrophomonadaceae bacterium]|nr:transcriptional repressor LexA [Syntrophomonadaceae bacterium]